MTQSTSNLLAELASSINPQTGKLGGGGTTAYSTVTDLPTSNIDAGSMAFVSESNKLYMWNGNAWFNIAILNQAPTAITGNEASYALAKDGTPTTVTLASIDPEGFPLTWSATTSGDTQVGTLTQADNVFTITPSTDEADIGTLSVTFSVTDGTNTENSTSTFTLAFLQKWDQNGGTIVMHFPETGNPRTPGSYFETEVGATTTYYSTHHGQWELVNGALMQRTKAARYLIHNGNYSQYQTNSNNAFTVSWWSIANTVSGPVAGGGGSYDWTMQTTEVDCAGGTSTVSFILQDNTWHHYAMISESGSLACKFYRDGTLITTVTMNGNTAIDLLSFALNSRQAASTSGAGFPCAYSDVYLIDNHAAVTEDFTPPTRTATFTGF